MIAVRHLNSNPEIAELPNIHPHGLHRGPTSHLPSCRPGGVHFTHHPTAPKQVLDILRKTPTAQNISPGIRASHKTFTISCSPPCSLSDFRTLTHTDKEKSQTPPPTHTRPPSPQLLLGDIHWSRECTLAVCREQPCITMRQPRGQQERPSALHWAEPLCPSKRVSPGWFRVLLHNLYHSIYC